MKLSREERIEFLLEMEWNRNKTSDFIHYILITSPWFEPFCKQHNQYSKTIWHRLFSVLLIYKRIDIQTLAGMFHKRAPNTDAFLQFLQYAEDNNVIVWDDESDSYYLNNLALSPEVQEKLSLWQFPMPLICKPRKLKNNYSSSYFTVHKDNVVISGIEGDDDVNLEHLDRVNSIAYTLNTDVAINCKNIWKAKNGDPEKVKINLKRYMKYCYKACEVMYDYAIKYKFKLIFHFRHKYDRRGRTYAVGHYFNPQGTDYNKYCLELAHKELVK